MPQETLLTAANPPAPLAERLRPQNLDEFAGQEHLLGKGDMLVKLIGQPLIRVHGVLIGHDDIAQGIARAKRTN